MGNRITVGPKRAMGLIKQAVEADVPVLLVGPPGSCRLASWPAS